MDGRERLIQILTHEARAARRSLQFMQAGKMTMHTNGRDTTADAIVETNGRISRIEESLRRLHGVPDNQDVAVWITVDEPAPADAIDGWVTFDLDEAQRAIELVVHQSQEEAEDYAARARRQVGWISQDGSHVCLLS